MGGIQHGNSLAGGPPWRGVSAGDEARSRMKRRTTMEIYLSRQESHIGETDGFNRWRLYQYIALYEQGDHAVRECLMPFCRSQQFVLITHKIAYYTLARSDDESHSPVSRGKAQSTRKKRPLESRRKRSVLGEPKRMSVRAAFLGAMTMTPENLSVREWTTRKMAAPMVVPDERGRRSPLLV